MKSPIAMLMFCVLLNPSALTTPQTIPTYVTPPVEKPKELVITNFNKGTPVTVTMYSFRTETASGTKPKKGTLAVSRDLQKKKYPLGSKVYLKGYGHFEVVDVMHERWRNRVDVWVPSKKKAKKHGVKYSILYTSKPKGNNG